MNIAAKLYRLDDRRSGRTPIDIDTTIREGDGDPVNASVSDLSDFGFRAEVGMIFVVGDQVGLELPGLGLLEAQVAWRNGDTYGFAFMRPINGAVALSAYVDRIDHDEAAELLATDRSKLVRQNPHPRVWVLRLAIFCGLALILLLMALSMASPQS